MATSSGLSVLLDPTCPRSPTAGDHGNASCLQSRRREIATRDDPLRIGGRGAHEHEVAAGRRGHYGDRRRRLTAAVVTNLDRGVCVGGAEDTLVRTALPAVHLPRVDA